MIDQQLADIECQITLIDDDTARFSVFALALDDPNQDDRLVVLVRNRTLPISARLASRPARMPVQAIVAT